MHKKILSLLLVACMVLPLVPLATLPVFATEGVTNTYTTTFSPGGENWPSITAAGAGGATFPGSWEIGGMSGTAEWNTDYYTATYVQGFGTARDERVAGSSQWMDKATGAGFYTTNSNRPGMLVAAIAYNKTPVDTGAESTLPLGDAGMTANPLIRYTVEYDGDITIDFNQVKFNSDNSMKFVILHNGQRVGDFYPEGETFDYIGGDGWLLSYNATKDISEDLNPITISDVKIGDKIDFVCRGNEDYQYGYEGFYYSGTKRGIYDYDISITYAEGFCPTIRESWKGAESADVTVNIKNNATDIFFLKWYKESVVTTVTEQTTVTTTTTTPVEGSNPIVNVGEPVVGELHVISTTTQAGGAITGSYNFVGANTETVNGNVTTTVTYTTDPATGSVTQTTTVTTVTTETVTDEETGIVTETKTAVAEATAVCTVYYAEPNPDLIEAGVFEKSDTYEQAMEKYRRHMMTVSAITYDGNWSYGTCYKGGTYTPIMYLPYLGLRNIFGIEYNSAKTIIRATTSAGTSRWVSQSGYDKIFDTYYNATWKTGSTNVTIPQKDTLLSNIHVLFSVDLMTNRTEGQGISYAPTTADAVAGLEGWCYPYDKTTYQEANVFYIRPHNGGHAGVFAYSVPAFGTLSLTVNNVSFVSSNKSKTTELDSKWALYINGEEKIPYTVFSNKTTGETTEDPAKTINDGIAAYIQENGEIQVNRGDLVEIRVLRNSEGTHVAMDISSELRPVLGNNVSLTITDTYAVNLYITPADPKATEVGAIINGEYISGEKQTNGSYRVVAREKINIYELAGSTDDKKGFEYAGESITYKIYEKSNIPTESDEKTVTTLELLNAYIAKGDATTVTLATAVRALAVASRAAMVGGYVVDGTTKSFLKQGKPTDTYEKEDGSTTDVNSSCPTDILLASLKYYTMKKTNETYEVPTYHATEGGGTVKIHTNDTYPGIENGVNYGYNGVDAKDESQFAFKIISANVNLGKKISLIFLADANGTNSMYDLAASAGNGYRLKIEVNGEAKYADFGYYADKQKMAAIVDEVPVVFYDRDLTITIVDAQDQPVSAALTYSVKAWCVRSYNIQTASSFIMYTVKGVYLLGEMAAAYDKAHS